MYSIFKRILFLFPPEIAHKIAMNALIIAYRWLHIRPFKSKSQEINFLKINFKNKIGVAAGFDKNAKYIDILHYLGFGFVEIGTVTPKPQSGNPKPRLFRLKKDRALMNRMGFNNLGVDEVVKNLKQFQNQGFVIGGNIGKNKDTPNEQAAEDYLICFQKLYNYVDYFVVNVSSPNTANLRDLQEKNFLIALFESLREFRSTQTIIKPILLKLAPDLSHAQVDEILSVYNMGLIDALIISNTTIDYSVLQYDQSEAKKIGSGGVSGHPLFEKTYSMIEYIKSQNADIKLIGVGGIDSTERAETYLKSGCDLLQVYTGFIYKGPKLIRDISSIIP